MQRKHTSKNFLIVPQQKQMTQLIKNTNNLSVNPQSQQQQFQPSQSHNQQQSKNNLTMKSIYSQQKQQKQKRKYKKKQKALTQQQIQVFRQAFQIFDSNHSGSIDQSQLKSLMSALGYNYSQQQIKHILQQIDQDGSGVIQIDQFVQFMSKHMLDTDNIKRQMKKVFKYFDDDNSGYIDFRKLKNMTKQCFFNLDDDAITNMLKSADIQGDLKITQYQFLRIMKKVKLI